MPLVQAKCTNCGANLEINNTLDAAVCPYCGAAFIVEKAINNFNTTNHINAGVVNVYGGSSADFVIRGGVLEKYNGAATEVVIPDSVKIIGDSAFSGCKGITSVVIPDSVQEIGSGAFQYCGSLTSIAIPHSVREIGGGAFDGCTALASVAIPDSVQEIGSAAFRGCGSLTAIEIPNSVKEIGYEAFAGCTALTSVTLPDSLEEIKSNLFSGCRALRAIKIPEPVNEIGEYAFIYCESLQNVEIKGKPHIDSSAFQSTPYQQAINQKQKSGCYIATAVYGSYDCPEVWTLRRFRDNTLDRTWYGRAFIRTYYAVSPTLVRWFGKDSWFQALFRPVLDRLVDRLRQSGVEDTAYQDKY